MDNTIIAGIFAIIGVLIGYILHITWEYFQKPLIEINKPLIKKEKGEMLYPTIHLRLPITAKRGGIEEVKAEIIGGSKAIIPTGPRILFWERQFKYHSHENLKTQKDVEKHMIYEHFKHAGPTTINEGETKNINLVVKVEGIKGMIIPTERGEKRDLNGEYEIKVLVSGKNTRAKTADVKFTVDSKLEKIEITNFSLDC